VSTAPDFAIAEIFAIDIPTAEPEFDCLTRIALEAPRDW